MLKDAIGSFVCSMVLSASGKKISDARNVKQIEKDIKEFAHRQFNSRFSEASLTNEIDFGGLLVYMENSIVNDVIQHLTSIDHENQEHRFNSIIEKACGYAYVQNEEKRAEVKYFVSRVLEIVVDCFLSKIDTPTLVSQNLQTRALRYALSIETEQIIRKIDDLKDSTYSKCDANIDELSEDELRMVVELRKSVELDKNSFIDTFKAGRGLRYIGISCEKKEGKKHFTDGTLRESVRWSAVLQNLIDRELLHDLSESKTGRFYNLADGGYTLTDKLLGIADKS